MRTKLCRYKPKFSWFLVSMSSSAVQFLQGCNFDDYFRIKMGLNFFKPSATANGAVLSKKIVTGYYSIYDVWKSYKAFSKLKYLKCVSRICLVQGSSLAGAVCVLYPYIRGFPQVGLVNTYTCISWLLNLLKAFYVVIWGFSMTAFYL